MAEDLMEDWPHVVIWTDGSNSLKAKGKPGGWAAILLFGDQEHVVMGSMYDCTNNQAELLACITGLGELKTPCRVDIFTDSEYVQKGWSLWLPNWLKHDWVNSLGLDVANRQLWQELMYLCEKHHVTFHHVMGHTGVEYNERADKLAKRARMLLQARPC